MSSAGRRASCALAVVTWFAVFALHGCGRGHPALPPPVLGQGENPSGAGMAPNAPGVLSPPSLGTPAPLVRRPGAYANLDPNDDGVVGPPDLIGDCEAALAAAGITFKPASLPVHTEPRSKLVCGAPQVVTYVRGPGAIKYNSEPVVTCGVALALASFERLAQEEANAIFGSPIVRIDHMGTYTCREIAAIRRMASEHSYANAIDVGGFVLKNGKRVEVLKDFVVSEALPSTREGTFLRAVSRRATDEDVFSVVLTPYWDDAHKNHFHMDLARYRVDGTRPHQAR